jgi:hypothetical protein
MSLKWENSMIVFMKLVLIGYLTLVANTESTSGGRYDRNSAWLNCNTIEL